MIIQLGILKLFKMTSISNDVKFEVTSLFSFINYLSDCIRDKHAHLSAKEISHHIQTSIRALKKPSGSVPRKAKASTPIQGPSDLQPRVLRNTPSRSARKENAHSACRQLAFEDSRELQIGEGEVLLTLNNVNNNWIVSPPESSLSRQSTYNC